jgi:hypothetical protein
MRSRPPQADHVRGSRPVLSLNPALDWIGEDESVVHCNRAGPAFRPLQAAVRRTARRFRRSGAQPTLFVARLKTRLSGQPRIDYTVHRPLKLALQDEAGTCAIVGAIDTHRPHTDIRTSPTPQGPLAGPLATPRIKRKNPAKGGLLRSQPPRTTKREAALGYHDRRSEGWQSGRMRRSRKPLGVQASRRFKSSPLRFGRTKNRMVMRFFAYETLTAAGWLIASQVLQTRRNTGARHRWEHTFGPRARPLQRCHAARA